MNFCCKRNGFKILYLFLTAIVTQSALAQQTIPTSNSMTKPSLSNVATMLQQNDLSLLKQNLSLILQTGVFDVSQGHAQNIGINGLIGDRFTIDNHHAQNYLLGLGIFIDGIEQERFKLMYGINAFYIAHTTIEGDVIQEQIFTNLAYSYAVTHIPIYIAAKALINTHCSKYKIALDFGVGPNIIRTSDFRERSLDGGITLPDRIFSGQTDVVLSATAAVGIRINNVLKDMAVECSYRFFYLGEGKLNKLSDQVKNTLNTGTSFANALMISIVI